MLKTLRTLTRKEKLLADDETSSSTQTPSHEIISTWNEKEEEEEKEEGEKSRKRAKRRRKRRERS